MTKGTKRALGPVLTLLMATWVLLNLFDLLVTYWAVGLERWYETNPFMASLLRSPPLAVVVKFTVVWIVIWAAERIDRRTPYSGIWPMLGVNAYLGWACVHNVLILLGRDSAFLRYYPLAGLPW